MFFFPRNNRLIYRHSKMIILLIFRVFLFLHRVNLNLRKVRLFKIVFLKFILVNFLFLGIGAMQINNFTYLLFEVTKHLFLKFL